MPIVSFADTAIISDSDVGARNILNETTSEKATLNGEPVLYSYEEDGELYVVTYASDEFPPGSGKCPARSGIAKKEFTRSELQSLRNRSQLEQGVRSGLAGAIASTYSVAYKIAFDVLGAHSRGLANDCTKILDNTSQKVITVEARFTCTSKVQAGNWFHVWKLSSVKAI